ncbi:uncharacterized protein FRV6_01322 [Fusarium oxysporum]|uniref:Uncharacterized protein n=2 Tax=Fusarium oxysporum TaxID=5507 RepID=N4UFI5_FUSC1|nr:hypothetical protein FOC1_g10009962 [Fusarium oxysporum f. sp. cubense race 1]SCO77110.1 uncharacterized protein FRV6_01322 [Fusarium oxysporum]
MYTWRQLVESHDIVDIEVDKSFETPQQLRVYAHRATGSRLFAISSAFDNWDKVRDLVVEEFTLINLFKNNQLRLMMTLLKWLIAIRPLIHEDLPSLSVDRLIQTWQEMNGRSHWMKPNPKRITCESGKLWNYYS